MATVRFLFVDDDDNRCRRMDSIVRAINAKLGEEHLVVLDIVMSADKAIEAFKGTESPYLHGGSALYDICSLDHDLAPQHYEHLSVGKPGDGTGMDIARFLAAETSACPKVVNVHSWNPDGRRSMASTIAEANDDVRVTIQKFPEVGWLRDALEFYAIPTKGVI